MSEIQCDRVSSIFKREVDDLNATKSPLSQWGVDACVDRLIQICEESKTGIHPRALLIMAKDVCVARSNGVGRNVQLSEILDDPEVVRHLSEDLNQGSDQSRAVAVAMVMKHVLEVRCDQLGVLTVLDLGRGFGDSLAGLVNPGFMRHDFVRKARKVEVEDGAFGKGVGRLVVVDRRIPTAEDVHSRIPANYADQHALVAAIAEGGDFGGRLVRVEADIRGDVSELFKLFSEGQQVLPVMLNVQYQLNPEFRKEVVVASDCLLDQLEYRGVEVLNALQMDTWQVFSDERPDVLFPGQDRPLVNPGFITTGVGFGQKFRPVVAKLDGTTGKPGMYFQARKRWEFRDRL